MKRVFQTAVLYLLFVGLTSMAAHQFYVAIYQIDFVPQKKRLEITTRIFMDDLNNAVTKAYKKNTNIGSEKETIEDIALLKKYLTENFKLTVNGKQKAYTYLSREVESNVVICYLSIKEISKVSALQVENSILTEIHAEQQNIIQYNNNGKKQNLLLSSSITKGLLK